MPDFRTPQSGPAVYLFIILVITMVDYQRIGNGGTRPATITLSNHSLSESALLPIKHLHQRGLLDQDDTSLIFPSLLTNAPQKVTCINSYFVFICPTLCSNFNIL